MHRKDMAHGIYLEVVGSNGEFSGYWYYGLDHSCPDSEDDELWAAVFALYCEHFDFPPKILHAIEKITTGLEKREGCA